MGAILAHGVLARQNGRAEGSIVVNKCGWILVACAGMALWLGEDVARAGTPPFFQCPAKGASPSCAVLITINPGNGFPPSLTYQRDPSVGPYDGADDMLIGVINESFLPVSSIPLSSFAPTDIFGFDGDGAGSATYSPDAGTFGPTGYEGPNTSFIITDVNDGTVQFAGGLADGHSLWFSLEGPPGLPLVSATKTITNSTGQAADELQIVLRGVQNVVSETVPTGWSFSSTVDSAARTTVLDWKLGSGSLPSGNALTVGFSIDASNPDFVGVAWLSGGTSLGCASQLTAYPVFLSSSNPSVPTVSFENNTTLCTQTVEGGFAPAVSTLFVSQASINWYSAAVPESQLIPGALPTPLRTDSLISSPIPIQAGGTAQIGLPLTAPSGASAGVIVYTVGKSSSPSSSDTKDLFQTPVHPTPVTGCTSSSQCTAGETCTNGSCVSTPLSCTRDSDCPSAQTCKNGVCVVTVPAAPAWTMGLLSIILAWTGLVLVRQRRGTT